MIELLICEIFELLKIFLIFNSINFYFIALKCTKDLKTFLVFLVIIISLFMCLFFDRNLKLKQLKLKGDLAAYLYMML